MEWTRDRLVAALTSDAPADAACREALRAGAKFLPPPNDQYAATAALLTIYTRRARHIAQEGIPDLGFARALDQLRDQNRDIRIASVHSDDFNFVIFLHPTEPTALACLAVDASAANPNWDYSAWD